MLLEEAEWIRSQIARLPNGGSTTLIDVGSSTEEYRRLDQPYIDFHVFRPFRRGGGKVVHLDAKTAEGVDRSLNLESPDAIPEDLVAEGDIVLCAGLLVNCRDRQTVVNHVSELVKPGGYLIVTAPQVYPLAPDPIDTMYRPSPEELAAEFGGNFAIDTLVSISAHPTSIGVANGPNWRVAARMARILISRVLRRVRFPTVAVVAGAVLRRKG